MTMFFLFLKISLSGPYYLRCGVQMANNLQLQEPCLTPFNVVFFLNVAASLVGGVKFVASLLYLEGKVFGYEGVAIVVFQAILKLQMCNF
jgi:hypothetical protein